MRWRRRDAAIVSAEAGTTRDVIEVRLDLAGAAGHRFGHGRDSRGGERASSAKASVAASRPRAMPISSFGSRETAQLNGPPGISRETSLVIRSKADLAAELSGEVLAFRR